MLHFYDFFIYCFIIAYAPGVNNLLSMNNVIRPGFRRSVRFSLGIPTGFTAVMSVCAVFSATLYSFLPKVKIIMQLLGAAYMPHLAWKVFQSSADLNTDSQKEANPLFGIILQFANPKIYIYVITVTSLYILPVYHSTGALIGFTALLSPIGTSGSLVWALFGAAFRKFFSKHTKPVNIAMAPLLAYCAVSPFLS